MKIYLVMCGWDYEGSDVKACLASREETESVVQKIYDSKPSYDTVKIVEWTVGEILEGK